MTSLWSKLGSRSSEVTQEQSNASSTSSRLPIKIVTDVDESDASQIYYTLSARYYDPSCGSGSSGVSSTYQGLKPLREKLVQVATDASKSRPNAVEFHNTVAIAASKLNGILTNLDIECVTAQHPSCDQSDWQDVPSDSGPFKLHYVGYAPTE